MDPETERQLAAIIMEEASRLKRDAERDGVAAYLAKPKVRGRANPQFLQATVRSIQQSNRIVEVNEMWRRRNVELEYERKRVSDRGRRRSDPRGESGGDDRDSDLEDNRGHISDCEDVRDDCLRDDELEQFLHSKVKRGRGAVGSRMDETGPYLPPTTDANSRAALMPDMRIKEHWEEGVTGLVAGPSLTKDQMRHWNLANFKRKQGDSNVVDKVEEFPAKRKHRKEKKENGERSSKKKKRKKRLEKSSKRGK